MPCSSGRTRSFGSDVFTYLAYTNCICTCYQCYVFLHSTSSSSWFGIAFVDGRRKSLNDVLVLWRSERIAQLL